MNAHTVISEQPHKTPEAIDAKDLGVRPRNIDVIPELGF